MFSAWDLDKSATLNLTELERGLVALGGGAWSADCENATVLFAEADTNNDGAVSKAEAGPMAMDVMGCLIGGAAACGSSAVVTVGAESFQCKLEEHDEHEEHEDEHEAEAEAADHVPSLAMGTGEWHCEDGAHEEEETAAPSPLGTAERWAWALLATFLVSLVALVGLLLLEGGKKQPAGIPRQMADDFGALAVGGLLGAVSLHMMPEALLGYGEPGLPWQLGVALMSGVLSAFVLEHTVVVLKGKAEVTVERMLVRGDVTPHARARGGSGRASAASASGAASATAALEEAAAATAAATAAGEAHGAEASAQNPMAPSSTDLAVTGSSMAAPAQGSSTAAAVGAAAEAAEAEVEAEAEADTESGSTGGADADRGEAGVVVVKVSGDGSGTGAGAADAAEAEGAEVAAAAADEAADGESKEAAPVAAAGFITTNGVVPELMHTPSAFAAVDKVVHTVFFGDLFHNAVDGLIIGVSFSSCDVAVGWAVTAAIVLHELPQEVGDYVVLRRAGLTRRTALLVNFASALGAFVGTIVALAVGNVSPQINAWMLFFTAGVLLVVALTDVMPELIHGEHGHTHGTGQGHKHSHGAGDGPHDDSAGGACVHGPGAHGHAHGHGHGHGGHAATGAPAKGASGPGLKRQRTLKDLAVEQARNIGAFVRPAFFLVLGAAVVGLTTLHDVHCEPGAEAGGHDGHDH